MEINLIALAIPVFFLLIFAEYGVALLQKRRDLFRINDAITDLSCGVGSQVIGVFSKGGLLLVYTWVYQHSALFEWSTVSAWLIALFGVDFAYYWWHRASHRINVLWAGHIVHHHSQDYNLAVALRQAWFTRFSSAAVTLPLAVLGVPPLIFAANDAINTLYQFWIHTRTIKTLGPLEWVFNTPAHHRVHHAINPVYIDKNYAGMLIIWDRMFGTFVPESEPCVFGTVRVHRSWNPIWANFHYWFDLAKRARGMTRFRDAIQVWFAPPEWEPGGSKTIPEVDAETFEKWDLPVIRGLNLYVMLHFTPAVIALVWMLYVEKTMDGMSLAVIGGLILWATWCFGTLFEGRNYAPWMEGLRLVITPLLVGSVFWSTSAFVPVAIATLFFYAMSGLWLTVALRPQWSLHSQMVRKAAIANGPPQNDQIGV